jgi:hypothetical protein
MTGAFFSVPPSPITAPRRNCLDISFATFCRRSLSSCENSIRDATRAIEASLQHPLSRLQDPEKSASGAVSPLLKSGYQQIALYFTGTAKKVECGDTPTFYLEPGQGTACQTGPDCASRNDLQDIASIVHGIASAELGISSPVGLSDSTAR